MNTRAHTHTHSRKRYDSDSLPDIFIWLHVNCVWKIVGELSLWLKCMWFSWVGPGRSRRGKGRLRDDVQEVQPSKVTKMCPVSLLYRLHNLYSSECYWPLSLATQHWYHASPHTLAVCPRYMQSHFCCVGGANCVKLAFTVTMWHMWRSGVHQHRVTFQQTVADSGISKALPKLCKKHSWSDQLPEVSGCLFQWTSPQ